MSCLQAEYKISTWYLGHCKSISHYTNQHICSFTLSSLLELVIMSGKSNISLRSMYYGAGAYSGVR